ncbi:MAG: hypothetical protein ACJ75F_14840, partial [Flavisolibacter sp.]
SIIIIKGLRRARELTASPIGDVSPAAATIRAATRVFVDLRFLFHISVFMGITNFFVFSNY